MWLTFGSMLLVGQLAGAVKVADGVLVVDGVSSYGNTAGGDGGDFHQAVDRSHYGGGGGGGEESAFLSFELLTGRWRRQWRWTSRRALVEFRDVSCSASVRVLGVGGSVAYATWLMHYCTAVAAARFPPLLLTVVCSHHPRNPTRGTKGIDAGYARAPRNNQPAPS